MNRVVITGMSGITSLGSSWPVIAENIKQGKSGTRRMLEWDDIEGLNTRLAAPVNSFELPEHFRRRHLRGAGRVSRLALASAHAALADAGLLDSALLTSGDTGVAYGSSAGSVDAVAEFGLMLKQRTTHHLNSTSYVRMMPHTTAVNLSVVFRTKGRIIPTSSACTSGSLAIGYAYEAIKNGYHKAMIAGGADELDATEAAVFDTLYATSLKNDAPSLTPSPFDRHRDGLVIGEGAATLILEDLENAQKRDACIHAEVIGFGTNSDGRHLTQPTRATMEVAMRLALEDAGITAGQIGYVSAHAAATESGDAAESHATDKVLGGNVPISSLKGYFGHTLGACGAIEAWLGVCGMNDNWFPKNKNLKEVDPNCADLSYICGEHLDLSCNTIMSNNFAFGGMNTSLLFRKFDQ